MRVAIIEDSVLERFAVTEGWALNAHSSKHRDVPEWIMYEHLRAIEAVERTLNLMEASPRISPLPSEAAVVQ